MTDFEAVYARHFDGVYRYVYSLCRDEHTAEEVTQESFYRAMTHMDRFDGRAACMCGCVRSPKRPIFTYVKSGKRRGAPPEDEPSHPGFEGKLLDSDSVAAAQTPARPERAVQRGVLPAGAGRAVVFSDRSAVRQVGQLGASGIFPGKNGVKEAGR